MILTYQSTVFFLTRQKFFLTERNQRSVWAEIISVMWLPPLSQLAGKISGSVRKLQRPGIVWAAFRQVLLNIHPLKGFPARNQAQYALVPRLSITDAPNEPCRSLVMKIHKTMRLFLTPIRWRAEGIWTRVCVCVCRFSCFMVQISFSEVTHLCFHQDVFFAAERV